MKKFLFAAILFTVSGFSIANAATGVASTANKVVMAAPPAAVVKSFIAIFGNVSVSEWKLRSNGQWRAHFLRTGIAWEATFTSTGVLVKSERD